jgi:hypothetical protein
MLCFLTCLMKGTISPSAETMPWTSSSSLDVFSSPEMNRELILSKHLLRCFSTDATIFYSASNCRSSSFEMKKKRGNSVLFSSR